MKTPSFLELKILVEYLSDEFAGSQLQEVTSTEEGLVLALYRYGKEPRMMFIVIDLDKAFPFIGFFSENPWSGLRKTRPVALFLNAHAKNRCLNEISLVPDAGRVVSLIFGEGDSVVSVEFRLIPRQANLVVRAGKKDISWYPLRGLPSNDVAYSTLEEEDVRSLAFLMDLWSLRRGRSGGKAAELRREGVSPFEKWKKNKEKDLQKKRKALIEIEAQISLLQNEEWSQVGEHLKLHGLKNLKVEWTSLIDFKKSSSQNMQRCFEKAKAVKGKVAGAENRKAVLEIEIGQLGDLSEQKFEQSLKRLSPQSSKAEKRQVAGRLRKMLVDEKGTVAYLGKSASDNLDLLRRSKPHDLWLHLKDYPSAHAIVHLQKGQRVGDGDIKRVAAWLVTEGLSAGQNQAGVKFSVVIVECRHVKALKGDKLGRVTYHNSREILIAV